MAGRDPLQRLFLSGWPPALTTWASGRVPGHNPMCAWQGRWFAAVPPRPMARRSRRRARHGREGNWREPNGDRRQENRRHRLCRARMDEAAVRASLASTPVSSPMPRWPNGPGAWEALPDPLPAWPVGGTGPPEEQGLSAEKTEISLLPSALNCLHSLDRNFRCGGRCRRRPRSGGSFAVGGNLVGGQPPLRATHRQGVFHGE